VEEAAVGHNPLNRNTLHKLADRVQS
jgi:hypothetical protein